MVLKNDKIVGMSVHPELARIFEHSLSRAAAALVRRCNENIVTSRRGSDVTLDAGRLCSVCHHLPEVVARFDLELAARIRAIEGFKVLRDISNTVKHGVLHNPDRQVELLAAMTYACLMHPPGADRVSGFAFSGTEVFASSALYDETSVLDLVYSFAKDCAAVMDLPEPVRPAGPGSIFVGEAVMRTAEETISFEDFELRFFKVEEGAPPGTRARFHPGPLTIQLLNMANIPLGKIQFEEPNSSYRQVTSAPSDEDRKRCNLIAYVADEALSAKEKVNVRCNCGALAPYHTISSTNVCECSRCGSRIGICGISGGPGLVPFRLSDGSTGEVPIQGFEAE
jgi:hypothetical protein